jgi:hypothetical protein
MLKLNRWCEHKGRFYLNIKLQFIFTKISIFDAYAKVALKWRLVIRAMHHTHMSSKHNKKHDHFSLWHILHILITYKLHGLCLCIDIHVGLMFIVIWLWMNKLRGVHLGEKSSINPNLVAWEVRGKICTINSWSFTDEWQLQMLYYLVSYRQA